MEYNVKVPPELEVVLGDVLEALDGVWVSDAREVLKLALKEIDYRSQVDFAKERD